MILVLVLALVAFLAGYVTAAGDIKWSCQELGAFEWVGRFYQCDFNEMKYYDELTYPE